MALFQRRPQTSDPTNYYTVGANKNVLLVGLGNPGKKYELTRHNAGFMCVDEFVGKSEEMAKWIEKKDLKCLLSTGQMGENRVIVIKPTTYMNLSGEAVQAAMNFYKIPADKVAVIHDELDIDFGQIRIRRGGSSAGHNGIKSVTKHIGEDYNRIRIGVGPKQPASIESEDFVLQKFSGEQQEQLPNMKREVLAILNEYLYGTELPHDTRSFLV
jgi:PTH1 family peptidyl-tRNA hydrolase